MTKLDDIISVILENLDESYDTHRHAQVKQLVISERANLLKEIYRKRGYQEWMKHTIKMPLIKKEYCFNIDCINLVSKYNLPVPISDTVIDVAKLNGEQISKTDFRTINSDRWATYTGKNIKYLVEGTKLYLTNTKLLKHVSVSGIFENYDAINLLAKKCTDCLDKPVFIKEDMVKDLYARVLQKLQRITPEYTQVTSNTNTNNAR